MLSTCFPFGNLVFCNVLGRGYLYMTKSPLKTLDTQSLMGFLGQTHCTHVTVLYFCSWRREHAYFLSVASQEGESINKPAYAFLWTPSCFYLADNPFTVISLSCEYNHMLNPVIPTSGTFSESHTNNTKINGKVFQISSPPKVYQVQTLL